MFTVYIIEVPKFRVKFVMVTKYIKKAIMKLSLSNKGSEVFQCVCLFLSLSTYQKYSLST